MSDTSLSGVGGAPAGLDYILKVSPHNSSVDVPAGLRSRFADAVICQDGTILSVQAAYGYYCTPRSDKAPYTHVEVKLGNAPADWQPYQDGHGSDIYGYVPVWMVRAFINAHGGEAR